VRIRLDVEACTGHGRCYTLAPDLFEPDERGHCIVLATEVDAEATDRAATAVANCPEHALSIAD
jgi:ferredoxin